MEEVNALQIRNNLGEILDRLNDCLFSSIRPLVPSETVHLFHK